MNGKPLDPLPSWRSLLSVDLKTRSNQREILDDQTSDQALVAPTLRNLEQINVMLSGIRSICNSILFRLARKDPLKTVTIADLGCGGGDLALWLAHRAEKLGIKTRIFGIDHDPRITELAKARCLPERSITIIHGDATDSATLPDPVDWVVSNHFIHHLDPAAVPRLLKNAVNAARRGVIMNDLIRSRLSLIAFNLLSRSIMTSGCTANDGLVSILRSYTINELIAITVKAGVSDTSSIVRSGIGHRALVIHT